MGIGKDPWVFKPQKPDTGTLGHGYTQPFIENRSRKAPADFDLSIGKGEGRARALVGQGFDKLQSGPGYGFDATMAGLGAQGGGSNQAQQAFSQAMGQVPADMSAYYEQAGKQAIQGIDKQAAARGVYGSSAAQELGQGALQNLAAQRAMQEGQYGINRAGMLGQLGQGAAASQQAAFSQLGQMSQLQQRQELEAMRGMADISLATDKERRGRVGDVFGMEFDLGNKLAGITGVMDATAFDVDRDIYGNIIEAGLGGTAAGAEAGRELTGDQARHRESLGEIATEGAAAVASIYGAG